MRLAMTVLAKRNQIAAVAVHFIVVNMMNIPGLLLAAYLAGIPISLSNGPFELPIKGWSIREEMYSTSPVMIIFARKTFRDFLTGLGS
mgnify:CR=1 FL=1